MPSNLFAEREKLNQLFKDEAVLYPEFLPDNLPHREKELDELVFALRPASEGKRPKSVFVFGPPGTGKTASVRFVVKQLEEFSGKAKGTVINCFEANSRHAVLSELATRFGAIIPRRGVGSDETLAEWVSVLQKRKILPIVVLDEADQLLSGDDGSKLLYDLLRLPEKHGIGVGVIIVSNDAELLASLDDRVKSSLSPVRIEFAGYSPQQLKQIFSERAEKAFFPGIVVSESIDIIAGHSGKLGGDCRVGIESLLAAGRVAEKENAEKLLPEHCKAVFGQVDKVSLEKRLAYLSLAEAALLKTVARHPDVNSGDLFLFYQTEVASPLAERMFRTMLSKLSKLGLVDAEETMGDVKGRTRRVNLVVSKEKVERL
ncbi:MAG: AAA family ATPase [Candidatus Diapherotrites archaeon]|uniref:ORC1-type DNA replication protein n=1 Tax=Candidatus Iainarchaeum sp. TaxID=3101447 RepID=A0A8T4L1M0_9ARCH|nr:AAA family ATPase [Candidatus Diapherotrites archaeon]